MDFDAFNTALDRTPALADSARYGFYMGIGLAAIWAAVIAKLRHHSAPSLWFILFIMIGGALAFLLHVQIAIFALQIAYENASFTFTDDPILGIRVIGFGLGFVVMAVSATLLAFIVPSAVEAGKDDADRNPCPHCAEMIMKQAVKCRFCCEQVW